LPFIARNLSYHLHGSIDLACARRKISLKGFALSPGVIGQSVIPGAIYHGDKSVSTRNFITFPMLFSKDAPSSRMYRMIRALSRGHRVSSRTPRSLHLASSTPSPTRSLSASSRTLFVLALPRSLAPRSVGASGRETARGPRGMNQTGTAELSVLHRSSSCKDGPRITCDYLWIAREFFSSTTVSALSRMARCSDRFLADVCLLALSSAAECRVHLRLLAQR